MKWVQRAFWEIVVTVAALGTMLHLTVRFAFRLFWSFERWWTQKVYYRAVVRRRRAAGEPEWKERDMMIGIEPPEGHPYWEKIPRITPLPGTILHGSDDFGDAS